jgi:hypothetical protein
MIIYHAPNNSKNGEIADRDVANRQLAGDITGVLANVQAIMQDMADKLNEAGIEYEVPDIYQTHPRAGSIGG